MGRLGLSLKVKPHRQEIRTFYNRESGLADDCIEDLKVDRYGRVWALTASGPHRYDNESDGFDPVAGFPCGEASSMTADPEGGLLVIGASGIARLADGKWAELPPLPMDLGHGVPLAAAVDHDGRLWAVTCRDILRLDEEAWVGFPAPVMNEKPVNLCFVDVDGENNICVGSDRGLWVFEAGGRWVQKLAMGGRYYYFNNYMHRFAVTANNDLWVATRNGLALFDGRETAHYFKGRQGLPCTDVRSVALGADGEVWAGTALGAAKLWEGRWQWYAGPRWLPHDEVRCAAVEPDGTAWFGTPGGVSRLEARAMSMPEKCARFLERLQQRHCRYGIVATSSSDSGRPGDFSEWAQEASDNDGSWTSYYLAAESFRYAVTGDPEAKANALEALSAIELLEAVTPVPGFPARSVFRKDEKVIQSGGEWHESSDGEYIYKGDTSSDELAGEFFALSIFHDVCADEGPEQQRVRTWICKVADHLIRNDFNLIDSDGQTTTWGTFRPSWMNHDHYRAQRGLNSMQALSFMKVAHHVSGDDKYGDAYDYLVNKRNFHMNAMNVGINEPGFVQHYDQQLAFLTYYTILLYEKNPALRSIYLVGMENMWQIARQNQHPFFNIVHALHTSRESELGQAILYLQEVPLDTTCWRVDNLVRQDLELRSPARGANQLEAEHPINPRMRAVGKLDSSPYRLRGGDDAREDDGGFLLMPYWMGRYWGFFEEAGQ